jgi:hypothetical protein
VVHEANPWLILDRTRTSTEPNLEALLLDSAPFRLLQRLQYATLGKNCMLALQIRLASFKRNEASFERIGLQDVNSLDPSQHSMALFHCSLPLQQHDGSHLSQFFFSYSQFFYGLMLHTARDGRVLPRQCLLRTKGVALAGRQGPQPHQSFFLDDRMDLILSAATSMEM